MRSTPRTIVIVGAGFSGSTVATTLLRSEHREPLRIVLMDRAQMARGLAYSKLKYPYLLNVPAGRMSANAADAGEFLAFARRRHANVTAEDFLPRELYGDYLESALASAESACAPHVELKRTYGLAIAIERVPRSALVRVHLADGRSLNADAVVLALGNPPPADLPGSEALRASARYIADPWAAPPQFRAGETLLVAGTGLTMADTVLAGMRASRGKTLIHAISRHGLIPPPQRPLRGVLEQPDTARLLHAASISLPRLVSAVRALAEEVELRGEDWRESIACVREVAPALWQRLKLPERRRFLRHVRSYWDLHRHRLAHSTWSDLHELRRAGQLQLHAGRILSLEPAGKQVRITWRARGAGHAGTLMVDRVINCTGPDYDVGRTRERLLRSLLAQGVTLRDPLGQGLVTNELGALINATGRAAANIFYVGPMLRASFWESTAVAELRGHAVRLAQHLSEEPDTARITGSSERVALFVPPHADAAALRPPSH
jgi:uncharacterized NAD(P)/FAD-binding protein YdhS